MWLLFVGEDYYPCGGADDLLGVFAEVDVAKKFAERQVEYRGGGAWAQILDLATYKVWKYWLRDSGARWLGAASDDHSGQWELDRWYTLTDDDGKASAYTESK